MEKAKVTAECVCGASFSLDAGLHIVTPVLDDSGTPVRNGDGEIRTTVQMFCPSRCEKWQEALPAAMLMWAPINKAQLDEARGLLDVQVENDWPDELRRLYEEAQVKIQAALQSPSKSRYALRAAQQFRTEWQKFEDQKVECACGKEYSSEHQVRVTFPGTGRDTHDEYFCGEDCSAYQAAKVAADSAWTARNRRLLQFAEETLGLLPPSDKCRPGEVKDAIKAAEDACQSAWKAELYKGAGNALRLAKTAQGFFPGCHHWDVPHSRQEVEEPRTKKRGDPTQQAIQARTRAARSG